MVTTPKRKLVVIEAGTLVGLAGNATALQEFPFLNSIKQTATRKPGCGSCARAKLNQKRDDAINSAKSHIAGLASDRKTRLKQILNAEKLRVSYMRNKKRITLTF